MRIAIYGPGRLGGTLAQLLPKVGHEVVIWRRGEAHPDADLRWLTGRDESIAQVAQALPPGAMVLHASGAKDLEVLSPHLERGSLHPIQSFPGVGRAIPKIQGTPAAIAGTPSAPPAARQIAEDLGFSPFEVPGDRRAYHAAAVMAGNFATVLLACASEALAHAGVSPDLAPGLLAPLALASIQQAASTSPAQALTGPFARGDSAVVQAHLAVLTESLPHLLPAYQALAERAQRLAAENHFPSDEG
jgi:predicted short-subunit dehydrogenase-like oxidoreductase (DUF2520 family)